MSELGARPEAVVEDGRMPSFAIVGTTVTADRLVGTGDPGTDTAGKPGRVIYVEILEPSTGRTWFGATRDWSLRKGLWHWSLNLSLAADTAQESSTFDGMSGAFEVVAYYEEISPEAGHMTTVQADPFDLKIVRPDAAGEEIAPIASIPELLGRIRHMAGHTPAHPPQAAAAMPGTPVDRFVFLG